MSWPLSQDYNEAIQSPASNFTDPDLKRGEAVANALGLPMPYSGNFADVYQVRCPDGKSWAVKCFTREAEGLRERYQEISAHLKQAKLPFTVDFSYLDKGIRVAGTWYPVLKMQWVEGLTLNQFIGQNLEKPAMLEALLQIWARMGKMLRAADIGHCDLQHGNVLLVPGATPNSLALKLIDYDGMWVPALAGKNSGEVGHPCYQHPQRLREGTYSLEVDRFPLLLVATAMRALKADKGLWAKYDNGDNMLFKESDLASPGQSDVFQELASLPDPGLVMLAAHVRAALRGSLESVPLLEDAMPDAKGAAPAPAPKRSSKPTAPSAEGPRSGTRVAPVVVAPAVAPPPAGEKTFAFDESAPAVGASSTRLKRTKPTATEKAGGLPLWVWIAGAAAAAVVLVGGAVAAFIAMSGPPKPPVGPSVVQGKPSVDPDKDSAKPDHDGNKPPRTNPDDPPLPMPQDPPTKDPGPWGYLDLQGAQNVDGVLRLPPSTVVRTKQGYEGPIEITLVARTEKNNIRLFAFNGACVIFNWEQKPHELRVVRPDGTDKLESGSLATAPIRPLEPDTWYTLRWRVSEEGMQVSVNDQIVFQEARKNDLSWKRQVGIASADSIVEAKSFEVKRLGVIPDAEGQIGEVREFKGHGAEIRRLAVSPDGKQLLTASWDKTYRLWNVDTGGEVAKWQGRDGTRMQGVAFLPDGLRALVCCSDDKVVRLCDVKDGSLIQSYEGHKEGVWQVAVSTDGHVAASCGSESTVFLWNVETGKVMHRLEGNAGGVESLAFSRDGKLLLTGANFGPLRLWDVETGKELRRLTGHSGHVMGAAFSPDNQFALSCGNNDETACIWRISDGLEVRRLAEGVVGFWSATLSPDGFRALTGSDDGTVSLWDTATGKELYRFTGHQGQVWTLAFSPDGKYAFSAGQDKVVRMWRLPPADYVPPPSVEPPPVVKKPEPKPEPPAGDALAAAEQKVKDVYKDEFKKKKKEEVRALADKLEKDALATKDTPFRYVLLREARDAGGRADDLPFAFRVADEMADGFAVSALALKVEAVEAAAKAGLSAVVQAHLGEAALTAAEEAEDRDDYEMAARAIKAAETAARNASSPTLETAVQGRAREIDALHTAYTDAVKTAGQTLTLKPDDPDANLMLGRFLCLDKGDWPRGLPMLSQGTDPGLKTLALSDLASVFDPGAQTELAKSYAARADGESGAAKAQLLRRACYWYQKAKLQLTGFPRTEVEKKIAEVEKGVPPSRLAIVCAWYGANNDWQEVTDKVRQLLVQGKGLKLTVKSDAGELGVPNHDNHQSKTLVIVYQSGGQTCLSLTSEQLTATIPAELGTADVDGARPAPGQDLQVLAAKYGAESNWEDCTTQVQHLVKGTGLVVYGGDHGVGDPAFGKHKALVLVYRSDNRVRLCITGQEQTNLIGTFLGLP